MKPSELTEFLEFSIENNFPVLIKGKPGIGKSEIVVQASEKCGANLIISHPVVSEPTDYKGLPFAVNGEAEFLPFGELKQLINADKKTVYFLDDLGQSPASVQSACMQLILARRINGHMVSNQVTFIAATNRREDKAAVSGILEPVKSRFASIVELEVNTDDWVKWGLTHNMPTELISFIRFRPELLEKFQPTRDIINSPSPRTAANIGKLYNAGIPAKIEYEVYKGTAGEAFAAEFTAFLKIWRNLPSFEQIVLNPENTQVPTEAAVRFAISGLIASKMNGNNIGAVIKYINRLPKEIAVATFKDSVTRNPKITESRDFITWASDNSNVVL